MNRGRFATNNMTKPERKWVLIRLSKYILQHKLLILLVVIFSMASNICSLIGPYLSGRAIGVIEKGLKGSVDMAAVLKYAGTMLVLYIFSAVFAYALSITMINLTRRVVKQLRSDIFNKLSTLPVGYFDVHQTGDLLSRVSYDIDVLNTSMSTDIVQILASVITIVFSFSMMAAISLWLLIIFFFTIPLTVVMITYITRKTRPLFRKRSAKLGELNGFIEEMISGQKTLKAYNQEETFYNKFSECNADACKAYYNADYYGTITGPSVNSVNNLSLALTSAFGAILFLKGMLGMDNVASFVLYSRNFSGPINEIANIIGDLQSALSAGERIFKLLDEEPEPEDMPGAVKLDAARGNIKFKNVNFEYIPGRPIINNLSLDIKPGSKVAIVGPTGAGKTTIINLLMRFYDPQSGSVMLDGRDIRNIKRSDLRKSYTMVLQDTWLFQGTVFENISYGKDDANLEEVKRACKAAGISSYIESLPYKYDTVINDDATNISKGQKQLLTIARAMLLKSHLLIFDEATSNVDTCTEEQIQKAMGELMSGKTCFIIAHRLSTIRNSDMIIVVFDGKIAETGSHGELMQKNGIYAGMYNAQFV